jgi:uncharacterized membrane protein
MLDVAAARLIFLVLSLSSILTSTCQLLALFVIFVGVMRALIIFLKDSLLKPQTAEAFQRSRLAMGYSFSLGLGFLVGATILKTMTSSRWDDIARLIAVIAVRTGLNLLLERALRQSYQVTLPGEPAAVEQAAEATLARKV